MSCHVTTAYSCTIDCVQVQLTTFIYILSSSIQPPGPGDPLVDSYTVNVSSTDVQRFCGSQTTGGNATSVVLDVTGCVMCQGSNKSYAVAVEVRNRGGQTTVTTSSSKVASIMYHFNIIIV